MKTKITTLVAVCMALGVFPAFAVTILACDITSAVSMVNTCVPEARLYVAGSSALGGALVTVIPADLFDTTATPAISILDKGSANGNAVRAWYGMSKAALTGGASKRLFVVYNNNHGSASGVSQLLVKENPANTALLPEADVVTIGPVKTGTNTTVANNCVLNNTSTPTAPVIACTTHGVTQADMAISDVNVTELYSLEAPSTGKLAALTTLTTTPLALQGFGVAVNANLYAALQNQNIAEGLLPGSCVGDPTAACQPSIRRADYASLMTQQGSIRSTAELLNNPNDVNLLIQARGSDLFGIQAASNIFFADNPCSRDHDSKGKLIKGVVGGELDIATYGINYNYNDNGYYYFYDQSYHLIVIATYDFVTAQNVAASSYAIGVLGLGNVPGSNDTWKFVKLDGISPNFNADGSVDASQRNAFASGDYPFAMIFYAVTPVKPAKSAVGAVYPAVVTAVINGLNGTTQHDLTGIAYLNGTDATKVSKVHRTNGNNCSPLIM